MSTRKPRNAEQEKLAEYLAVRQRELVEEAAADARKHTEAPFEYEMLPEPPRKPWMET